MTASKHIPARFATFLFAVLVAYLNNPLPARAGLPPQVGIKKILVMLVDFPDLPNTAPSIAVVSNAMLSANASFQSNSFNQFSITSTVIGTLRMPSNSTSYVAGFNVSGLRNDALAAARSIGYDPTNYDYDILTFTYVGFPFSGWGTYGNRGLWVQNYPGFPFTASVVEHELGHNFGLGHAHAWISSTAIGSGTSSEGGNLFDTMGGGNSHFNTNFKLQLGWLSSNYVHTATSNGTYRIYAHDQCGNLNGARKYGLVVPAAVTTPGVPVDYWVEARRFINTYTVLLDQVLIMWANTLSANDCYLLDTTPGSQTGGLDLFDCALTVGRSFTDPNKKISIAPIAKGGTGADTYFDIHVTLNSTSIPPAITIQPVSQTVIVGSNAFLSVTATSSIPIAYQWCRYGLIVSGATNAALSITNATANQSGDYTVSLSNSLGSVVSATASLTVNYPPASSCYPAPSGMVAWWTGDGHPLDYAGTNHGALQGSASYSQGVVNEAISLNGATDFMQVPCSPAWAFGTNAFTIGLWVNFFSVGGDCIFVGADNGPGQLDKWFFWLNDQQLRFYAVNAGGYSDNVGTARFSPVRNQWYYVAVTRSGTVFTFYINGGIVSTNTSIVTVPAPTAPLTIGAAEGAGFIAGQLDEIQVYRRSLSASEILSIYATGKTGVCWPANPPAYVEFSSMETAVEAGTNSSSVSVRRSGNTNTSVSLKCNSTDISALADVDYVPVASTVTFNPSQCSNMVDLTILNVVPFSGKKQFSLQLFPSSGNVVVGAKAQNTVSIIGNGCLAGLPGLVGWWTGDNHAIDLVSTNHGVPRNGAGYAPGRVGYAFSFDGVDDYVEIPNPVAGSFDPGRAMSICLWVYRTSTESGMHLLGKRFGCTGTGMNYQLAYGPGFGGLFFNGDNGGVYPVRDMPTNAWIHVAVTFDGGTFGFYIDGMLAGTSSGDLGLANAGTLRFGKSGDCGGAFGGKLDEIMIFNRELSRAEIQSIYDAGDKGMCALPAPVVHSIKRLPDGQLQLAVSGYPGSASTLLFSTNLFDWQVLSNITLQSVPLVLTNNPPRSGSGFYRGARGSR